MTLAARKGPEKIDQLTRKIIHSIQNVFWPVQQIFYHFMA